MVSGQSSDFSLLKEEENLFLNIVYDTWYICRFLFDESCPDYKYYEYQLSEEEKALSQTSEAQTSHSE